MSPSLRGLFKPRGWGSNRSSVDTKTNRADVPSEAKRDAYESYMQRAHELEPNQCVDVENYVEALIFEKSTLAKRCSALTTNYDQLEANIRWVAENLPGRQVTNENATGDKTIEDLVGQIPQDFYHVVNNRDELKKELDQLKNQYEQLSHNMNMRVFKLERELNDKKRSYERSLEVKEEEKKQTQLKHRKEIQELKDVEAKEKTQLHERFQDLELRFLNSADDFQPQPDKKFDSDITTLKLAITGAVYTLTVTKAEIGTLFDQNSFVESVNTDREAKLVLEYVLWKIICERLFSTPFRVFGEYWDGLFKIWCQIFQNGIDIQAKIPPWPDATMLSERWRHNTIRSLSEASQLGGRSNRCNTAVRSSYDKNMDTIQKDMETVIQKVSPDPTAYQSTLREIVDLAAKLALDCSLQHCRIQPSNFAVGVKTNQTMKNEIRDRNSRNSAGTTDGVVRLFIAPGLQRIGDGRGGSMDRPPVPLSAADVFLVNEA